LQVKYKKHKKSPAGAVGKNHAINVLHHPAALTKLQHQQLATVAHLATEKHKQESPGNSLPPHLVNGLILKTALTNPSEVRKLDAMRNVNLLFDSSYLR
jgi:hypothetical protein